MQGWCRRQAMPHPEFRRTAGAGGRTGFFAEKSVSLLMTPPMPLSTSASDRKPLPFTSNARKSSLRLALSSAEVPAWPHNRWNSTSRSSGDGSAAWALHQSMDGRLRSSVPEGAAGT